ncbi:hypothetical protein GH714_037963 [Hevea brasiliensis]|uniref:CASP-like protein n=1 Tax=Hevea brasiliensis TaxID=3981 RepID=A0A6A6KL53_HEVBR|nr:hypothetical protein GH714_037963 [Hevea brasiliensis]
MSTTIDIPAESSAAAKGKAPLIGITSSSHVKGGGYKKGFAICDFLLRLGAVIAALSAAATMGTSGETLPFFTQFFQFEASYDDLPSLQYVALTLNTAAAAAATAIVYLAHNGNPSSNWLAVCQQFGDFCQKVSGAVVASFVSVVVFMLLVVISGLALRRQN